MNSNRMDAEVAIIGGGPGGLAAAKEAGRLGARVTLIEQDRPGGRALWHSLVPSKVWLNAANLLGETAQASSMGLTGRMSGSDLTSLQQRLQQVKQGEHAKDTHDFKELGINVISGTAQFIDDNTLQIHEPEGNTRFLKAGIVVIATGSVPIFPPALKPDGQRILAPRFLSKLNNLPESMIVVGGGVTGSEVIYLFNRLGTDVTAITDIQSLLPRADQEVSQTLEALLSQRGVKFHKEIAVKQITNKGDHIDVILMDDHEMTADYAFVAIGRKPDVTKLKLQATSVEFDEEFGIQVNEYCQTSVRHIYAVGDVTGAPMLANRAAGQGRIAARNAIRDEQTVYHPEWTVEAVYTEPEVAQVGMTETQAHTRGLSVTSRKLALERNLKSHITGHQHGFLKLLIENNSEKLLGAAAIGSHAGDLLAPVAVALRGGLTMRQLLDIAPANPTLSELIIQAE